MTYETLGKRRRALVSLAQRRGNADRRFRIHFQSQTAKLLYYAQGAFLGLTGKPLFEDDLVAWAHGPVVVDVYHEYCSNGARGIEYDDDKLRPKEEYTQEEKNILNQVYDYFGQYSAWKLRNMTHQERPWKETMQNHVIPKQLIEEYFREEYVDETA